MPRAAISNMIIGIMRTPILRDISIDVVIHEVLFEIVMSALTIRSSSFSLRTFCLRCCA